MGRLSYGYQQQRRMIAQTESSRHLADHKTSKTSHSLRSPVSNDKIKHDIPSLKSKSSVATAVGSTPSHISRRKAQRIKYGSSKSACYPTKAPRTAIRNLSTRISPHDYQSTSNSPRLPVEIVSYILTLLWDDQYALYRCLTLSRDLMPFVKRLLYANIHVKPGLTGNTLAHALDDHNVARHLRPSIRSLHIKERSHDMQRTDHLLLSLAGRIRHLESLHLENVRWALPTVLSVVSVVLSYLGNITRLRLDNCKFQCVRGVQRILCSLPHLEDFSLQNVHWENPPCRADPPQTWRHVRLRQLHIEHNSAKIMEGMRKLLTWLLTTRTRASLETFKVNSLEDTDSETSLDLKSFVEQCAQSCGANVKVPALMFSPSALPSDVFVLFHRRGLRKAEEEEGQLPGAGALDRCNM